ncbi:transporter substrate-binding domain-containing protein [Vibrio stylophorae]
MKMKSVLWACAWLLLAPLAHASDTPNLDKINERGVLRVGMSTFVPWAMRDKQGDLIGFEIDVAKRLAADSGWQVEFIPTAWDGIIPALLANKFDVIIGGMTITPERSKSVLFSVPYSHSGIQIAVNRSRMPDVKTHQDLNSRRVKIAARRGATTVAVAREYFPKARILQFDDEMQAFQEVLNGNADAVISASPKPEYETLAYPDILYLPFAERLDQGNEAVAMRLGETDIQAFLNQWIQARTDDGWLKARYEYWFASKDWQSQMAQ